MLNFPDQWKQLWSAYSKLRPYVYLHRGAALLSLFCITVGAVINISLPLLLRDLSERESIDPTAHVGTMCFLFLIYHIVSCFGHYTSAVGARRLESHLCEASLKTLNDRSFKDVIEVSPEIFASNITQGAQHVRECFTGFLTDFYQSVVFLVAFTLGLLSISPQLSFLLVVFAVLNRWASGFFGTDFSVKSRNVQRMQAIINKKLAHAVSKQSTIRLFSLQCSVDTQLKSCLTMLRHSAAEMDWKLHSSSAANFGFNNILYVLLVAAGRHYKDLGVLTTGDILLFFFYAKRWLDHAGDLSREINKVRIAMGSTEGLLQYLDEHTLDSSLSIVGKRMADTTEKSDHITEERIVSELPYLTLQGVTYMYGPRDVSMTFYPGKLYGIVGYSGQGKTTLARLMTSLLLPTAGTVSRRVDIALCEQDAGLLDGTLWENIAYGSSPSVSEKRILQAASRAALDDVIEALPQGLHTSFQCEGETPLSGGQIQRFALARTFLSDAPIIVLDEPTKGLDAAAAAIIFDSVDSFVQEGRTVIIITHQLQFLRSADYIYVLSRGIIESEGSPSKLLSSSLAYQRLSSDTVNDDV